MQKEQLTAQHIMRETCTPNRSRLQKKDSVIPADEHGGAVKMSPLEQHVTLERKYQMWHAIKEQKNE
jgi:hypothetical protein